MQGMRVRFGEIKLTLKIWDAWKCTVKKEPRLWNWKAVPYFKVATSQGVFQGGYQSSGMVLPAANYFTIVTPALQKNNILSMGRAHLFHIEAQESIKDKTFVAMKLFNSALLTYPYTRSDLINHKSPKSNLNLYSLHTWRNLDGDLFDQRYFYKTTNDWNQWLKAHGLLFFSTVVRHFTKS